MKNRTPESKKDNELAELIADAVVAALSSTSEIAYAKQVDCELVRTLFIYSFTSWMMDHKED